MVQVVILIHEQHFFFTIKNVMFIVTEMEICLIQLQASVRSDACTMFIYDLLSGSLCP